MAAASGMRVKTGMGHGAARPAGKEFEQAYGVSGFRSAGGCLHARRRYVWSRVAPGLGLTGIRTIQ